MADKATSPNYILNEASGRYVLKTGKIGKAILKQIELQENNLVYPEALLSKGLALKAEYAVKKRTSTKATFTRIAKFLVDNKLDVAITRKNELFDKYNRDTNSLTKKESAEMRKLEKLLKTPVHFE
jgi:uncharacterized protein with ParB-like and HNH nuclease domain